LTRELRRNADNQRFIPFGGPISRPRIGTCPIDRACLHASLGEIVLSHQHLGLAQCGSSFVLIGALGQGKTFLDFVQYARSPLVVGHCAPPIPGSGYTSPRMSICSAESSLTDTCV